MLKIASKKAIPAISFGVLSNDETAFLNNSSNKEICISEASIYQIGSLTKVFTAALILIAEKDNKLNLNSTLNELFYKRLTVANNLKAITIYELLMHLSGLPRIPGPLLDLMRLQMGNPYTNISKQYIYSLLEEGIQLEQKKYAYSNFGYGLLGLIIEEVTGHTYENYLAEKIFRPLKMNASFVASASNNFSNVIQGYGSKNNLAQIWTDDARQGAGSILSTTIDISKFLSAFLKEDYEYADCFKKMLLPNTKKMGIGWHKQGWLNWLGGVKDYYWHNGMVGGYYSYAAISSNTRKGIVLLSNKAVALDTYSLEFLQLLKEL